MKWNDLPFLIKLILAALLVTSTLFVMNLIDPDAASAAIEGLKDFLSAIVPFSEWSERLLTLQ